jgi:hypothetical protein
MSQSQAEIERGKKLVKPLQELVERYGNKVRA